jgi:acyl-CoA hydrolase
MILTLTERPTQEHERKLAKRIAELIPEHACLQIGVGGVPSGVCEALMDVRISAFIPKCSIPPWHI